MAEMKNANDLVCAVAKRAHELANKKLDNLRGVAGYGCDTEAEAVRLNKHRDRGDLIEEILTEEFWAEFPKEFADD